MVDLTTIILLPSLIITVQLLLRFSVVYHSRLVRVAHHLRIIFLQRTSSLLLLLAVKS